MRIIRFIDPSGAVCVGEWIDPHAANVLRTEDGRSAFVCDDSRLVPLFPSGEMLAIGKLLTPIAPPNILCAGRNYPGCGASESDELELFMKPTTSLHHPEEPVMKPSDDCALACEGELAVIIGRAARQVQEGDSLAHVFGYTLANDITARKWQTREGPPRWMRGKGFDTFCPIGPAILPADDLRGRDPSSLEIITTINGKVSRQGNAGQMLRSVPRLIVEISARITLLPGTVILTGAPRMMEGAQDMPLSPGDRMEVHCDAIGTLTNIIHSQ